MNFENQKRNLMYIAFNKNIKRIIYKKIKKKNNIKIKNAEINKVNINNTSVLIKNKNFFYDLVILCLGRKSKLVPQLIGNRVIERSEYVGLTITGTLSEINITPQIATLSPGRTARFRINGIDENGVPVKLKATTELLAQALEHECDHLDGVLYTDLLKSNENLWQVEIGMEEENEG